MSLFGSFVHLVQTNQMLQAALVAAPATALGYSARALPKRIYEAVKKLVSVEVRFNSDSPDFEAVARFITQNIVYDKFSRKFNYQAETKWDSDTYDDVVKNRGLTAGYGYHLGFYNRHLCIVERHTEDGNQTEKFKEVIRVTFFVRNKRVIRDFVTDVAKAAGTNVDEFSKVPIYINSGDWWRRSNAKTLRPIETVMTRDDVGQKLVKVIKDFEASKDLNIQRGLPHHLGILLYGKPGCGKSSLIHAIASETQRSLFYLSLGAVKNDQELTDLICSSRDWSKIILVIEDFDAAGAQVDSREDEREDSSAPHSEPRKPITLSALLNVLDGIISPEGLVTIATTNHPEKLDEALVRDGRFDHRVELEALGNSEFVQMCHLFGREPQTVMQPDREYELTGAEMRSLILKA